MDTLDFNLEQLILLVLLHCRSLSIKRNALGENDPDVAMSYLNIGTLCATREHYEESLEYFKNCYKIITVRPSVWIMWLLFY